MCIPGAAPAEKRLSAMDRITYDTLVAMFRSAATVIRDNSQLLSQLDSVGGDGDHGTTMARAMAAVEKALEQCSSRTMKALLENIGWAVMGIDGGATGPLLGTFFAGMADALGEADSLSGADLAKVLEAGLARLRTMTRADVGDKTMMDAIIPAVAAARRAADDGRNAGEVLAAAAAAAQAGAESTKNIPARYGRAKNIREKSIGSPDAGATSVSLILKGFSQSAG